MSTIGFSMSLMFVLFGVSSVAYSFAKLLEATKK